MVRKDVECFDIAVSLWLLLMLVITRMIINTIYALVTIAKWYAHSFNNLCINKMPLVLKHMLVNCNSNMCSEV